MDKKSTVFKVLFRICGSVGIYIVGYLLAVSVLTLIPVTAAWHPMYLNAIGMLFAAIVMAFTIQKQEIALSPGHKPLLKIAAVVILAYCSSALFNILLGLVPWDSIFGSKVTPEEAAFYGIPLIARMVCYEIVAPVAEELLFRQVIYIRLRRFAPTWIAVVVSALLFGIYHGNLVQGIYAFIMGCLLALVYEWTRSLAAPILFHMIANHLSDIAYEFEAVSKVVYSPPAACVSAIVIPCMLVVLVKNKNKCSKNALK